MSIAENLERVRDKIVSAARRAGRSESEITLVAVSKKQPIEKIIQALSLGQSTFGENYVQELLEKRELLQSHEQASKTQFHFIGKLQSNKVRKLIGSVELIHSIDSFSLAQEVSRRAIEAKLVQDILIEVNIGEEDTKAGVELPGAMELLKLVKQLKNLRLRGVMSLPPFTQDASLARSYLKKTFGLYETLRNQLPMADKIEFSWVSMGTSHDFEMAVEEGATHVRVGTAIFGERA